MACSHPLEIPNQKYGVLGDRYQAQKMLEVPCRWCLNCRVDQRNWYEDCSKAFLRHFHGHATFLTVTYDDYHLNYVSDKNGKLCATLRYNDFKLYIDNIKRDVRKHYTDTDLSSHNFSYLVVGEYGDGDNATWLSHRPHYHALIFGLDYKAMDKLFRDKWRFGKIVAPLPLLAGGTRYVLKYLDKQQHGKQLITKYDDNNLERPFCHHSTNFGKYLINENIDIFLKNGGSYKIGPCKYRPLPTYYRNKYLLSKSPRELRLAQADKLLRDGYTPTPHTFGLDYHGYSLQELNNIRKLNSQRRELSLWKSLQNDGIPYDHSWIDEKINSFYDAELEKIISDCLRSYK